MAPGPYQEGHGDGRFGRNRGRAAGVADVHADCWNLTVVGDGSVLMHQAGGRRSWCERISDLVGYHHGGGGDAGAGQLPDFTREHGALVQRMAGSWMAEFIMFNTTGGNARLIAAVAPGGGSITPLYANPSLQMGQYDGAAAVSATTAITANAVSKAASTWAAANGRACANGGAVASGAMSTGFASLTTPGIGFMTVSSAGSPDNGGGWLRRVSYWPRVLTGIEMQSVTT